MWNECFHLIERNYELRNQGIKFFSKCQSYQTFFAIKLGRFILNTYFFIRYKHSSLTEKIRKQSLVRSTPWSIFPTVSAALYVVLLFTSIWILSPRIAMEICTYTILRKKKQTLGCSNIQFLQKKYIPLSVYCSSTYLPKNTMKKFGEKCWWK